MNKCLFRKETLSPFPFHYLCLCKFLVWRDKTVYCSHLPQIWAIVLLLFVRKELKNYFSWVIAWSKEGGEKSISIHLKFNSIATLCQSSSNSIQFNWTRLLWRKLKLSNEIYGKRLGDNHSNFVGGFYSKRILLCPPPCPVVVITPGVSGNQQLSSFDRSRFIRLELFPAVNCQQFYA